MISNVLIMMDVSYSFSVVMALQANATASSRPSACSILFLCLSVTRV